jgi:putative ABC transport system ATP-binding protein
MTSRAGRRKLALGRAGAGRGDVASRARGASFGAAAAERAKMIELSGVTKAYGEGSARVEALKGVDLTIAAGEFVSVMGPSGSGKSTLLNLVAALDVPTTGEIRVGGEALGSLDDDALTLFRRRKLGLIFQFFNLLPTLDALDNVLLPVMLERRPSAEDRRRAEGLLAEVGLAERARHRPAELSGGEMQRVAIARSLILEPRLLLADEPTGNLDSRTGAAILRLLKGTCASRGATIVMVTHDVGAAHVGDRIVSLKDGKIVGDERVSPAEQAAAGARGD